MDFSCALLFFDLIISAKIPFKKGTPFIYFKKELTLACTQTSSRGTLHSECHGTAINDTQRTENYHFGCVRSSKLVNKPAVSAMDDLNQQG